MSLYNTYAVEVISNNKVLYIKQFTRYFNTFNNALYYFNLLKEKLTKEKRQNLALVIHYNKQYKKYIEL